MSPDKIAVVKCARRKVQPKDKRGNGKRRVTKNIDLPVALV